MNYQEYVELKTNVEFIKREVSFIKELLLALGEKKINSKKKVKK